MSKPVLRLDWCSYAAAKHACTHWHYAGSMPLGKTARVGVWESGRFVGAIIFTLGSGRATHGKRYGLSVSGEMAELQRVALRDHQHEVSRMVAVAVRMMRRLCPSIRLLVSFADPAQDHHGGIYQACGWVYCGKTAQNEAFECKDGSWALSRSVYGGWARNQDGIAASLLTGRKRKLPGKHRYLLPLDREMAERIAPLAKPYPKRAGSAASGTPGNQPGGGGATPTPALCTVGNGGE